MRNETDDRIVVWEVFYQVGNWLRAFIVSPQTKAILREAYDEAQTNDEIPYWIAFTDFAGSLHELPRRSYLYAVESTPASRERIAEINSALKRNARIRHMIEGDSDE